MLECTYNAACSSLLQTNVLLGKKGITFDTLFISLNCMWSASRDKIAKTHQQILLEMLRV